MEGSNARMISASACDQECSDLGIDVSQCL